MSGYLSEGEGASLGYVVSIFTGKHSTVTTILLLGNRLHGHQKQNDRLHTVHSIVHQEVDFLLCAHVRTTPNLVFLLVRSIKPHRKVVTYTGPHAAYEPLGDVHLSLLLGLVLLLQVEPETNTQILHVLYVTLDNNFFQMNENEMKYKRLLKLQTVQ